MDKNYIKEPGMLKRHITKIWLIMRLTVVILIATLMQVSAAGYAQKISLSKSNTSLKSVIKEIRTQSGYNFVYTERILDDSKPVTINVKDVELEQVLKMVFDEQPLTYSIDSKTIIIKAKEPSILDKIKTALAAIDVTGRVLDENGKPITGATVMVKDHGSVTTTDAQGYFTLKSVNDKAIIIVSVIGYEKRELPAAANIGDIRLVIALSKLNEVQVIAYGTTTQRLSTGSISTVKAEDIAKQPVNNPLLALEGRVPGLFITQSSGLSGTGVTVRIQGQNSISKGNDPFYVIDGVPFASQRLPNLGTQLGTSGGFGVTGVGASNASTGNPFSYLNPADIESITILKDADATAIYGSRAANGAILITTKQGKAGATKVDITMSKGVGEVSRMLPLMNSEQYLAMRREAYKNDGLVIPTATTTRTSNNYDFTLWDNSRYTDWQKELIGGAAHYTDVQASASGGNMQTSFRVSGGYHRETTVFPGNFDDVKSSFGFNINHASTDQKFKIQLSTNYLDDNNQLPTTDLTQTAIRLAPVAPAIYKADGSLNWQRRVSGNDSVSTWLNPLAVLNNRYTNKTKNLSGNLVLRYEILTGLNLKTTMGYNNLSNTEVQTFPLTARAPELRPTISRQANYGEGNFSSWIVEPQVTYNRSLGKGKLDVLLGSTFQQTSTKNQLINGLGYNSDLLLEDIQSASSVVVLSTLDAQYKYAALFGRVNFNWNDNYILNVTARRDGSSRFGPENQFHNFGAVGAAWLFSNEAFIKKTIPWLSFGKFRASYGTTGNDQIGEYQFMNVYSTLSGITNAYQGVTGLAPTGLSNPYLQWELVKKFQTGIDLGFLKDRILLNINYFKNRSSNQLLSYTVPSITGFTTVALNFPATVENTGWEFSLNTINVKKQNFNWSSNFNLTIPKNKLVDFPNLAASSYANTLVVGQPINIQKLYTAKVSPQTGEYQFTAGNGSTVTTPAYATDRNFFYDPNPKFYGGFENSFSYKAFSLDFIFQFVKQMGLNYALGNFTGRISSSTSSGTGNQPIWVLDRWQNPGDITTVRKYSVNNNNDQTYAQTTSNLSYSDASYIRLKNISFSYTLPKIWQQAMHLQNCRLFLQGQNVLTITNFKGMDPENQSTTNLPTLRMITMGIQCTL